MPAAALHALQHRGRRVLQGNVDVGADFVVAGDRLQQPLGDLVGIGVEKAHPAQLFDERQPFEQQRQAVFQAEVFAVAGGVLADERDLAHAASRQALRLGHHRLEAPRAELAPQLRDDAERARMIAALGDLDVRRPARRRQHARRVLVVEIVGKIGDGAVPLLAGEASFLRACRGFRPARQDHERRVAVRGRRPMPAAARMLSSSPVPTTASTSGMFFWISLRKRSTRQPATTSFLARPAALCRAISRMVLTDSCCAVSMNEQVLTTMTSASSARGVISAPARATQAHHHLAVHQVLGTAQADEADFHGFCGGSGLDIRLIRF